MVSNPYHFSRLGTTVSAQITDGTDAPHTGLIKALSVYSSGSYPVKTSSDFDITAASANTINITSGKVVRDGELQASITAGSGLSIGDTSAGKTYSLVVVDSSNAFAVRTTTTDNIVPEMSNGDIPIALVLYTSVQSTMEFQYFTNRKESNTLSVAYANSNVYTEILEMKGNAGNVELTGSALTDISSLDSANDRLLVRDATNNQLKLVAPADVGGGGTVDVVSNVATNTILGRNDAGSGDSEELTPAEVRTMLNVADGATAYADSDAILAVEGEATLDLTGDVTIADKKFIVDTTTLVVNAPSYLDKVGIGTATPSDTLSVQGTMRSSSHATIGGDLDHNGTNIGFFGTSVQPRQTVNNLGASGIASRPFPDPTASPGFEPSVDAYMQTLEDEIATIRAKLDSLIDALQAYGLIV